MPNKKASQAVSATLATAMLLSALTVPAGAADEVSPQVTGEVEPVVSQHEHTYEDIVTPATCTEPGQVVQQCEECEVSITTEIPPLGHSYELTEYLYPTEQLEGFNRYTCSVCGDSYSEIVGVDGQTRPATSDEVDQVRQAALAAQATPSPSESPEPSVRVEPSQSVGPSPSEELSPSEEPSSSVEPAPSAEPSPSKTPGVSASPSPTTAPSEMPSALPSASPEPSPVPANPSPVPSPEESPVVSPAIPGLEPEETPALDDQEVLEPALDEEIPENPVPALDEDQSDPEDGIHIESLIDMSTYKAGPVTADAATIYSYLRYLGFNPAVSCAILANIEAESDFKVNSLGDNGTSFGLLQWHNSRWVRMNNFCRDNGYDPVSIQGQLEYLVYELEHNESTTMSMLQNIPNNAEGAAQAASIWTIYFERPAAPEAASVRRATAAMMKYWPQLGANDIRAEVAFDESNRFVDDIFYGSSGAVFRDFTRDNSYSGSQFFVDYLGQQDVKFFGHLDPFYTGSVISNLTDQERLSLFNAILGEGGENLTKCVLTAQLLHDQYVYLGAHDQAYSTVESMLTTSGSWNPNYWNVEIFNPEELDYNNASIAFFYVFEQGNAFVQHVLLGTDDPEILNEIEAASWKSVREEAVKQGLDPELAELPKTPVERIADIQIRDENNEILFSYSLMSDENYDLPEVDPEHPEMLLAERKPEDPPVENPNAVLVKNLKQIMSRDDIHAEMIKVLYQDNGGMLSCEFDGYTNTPGRHEGIDFTNYAGAPIYSLVTGKILRISVLGSGLSTLAIYDMENNVTVIYLHSNIDGNLKAGDMVHKGSYLGTEGSHGATAAHTHVEVVEGVSYYANVSVNDGTLENADPYGYWQQIVTRGDKLTEVTVRNPDGTENLLNAETVMPKQ